MAGWLIAMAFASSMDCLTELPVSVESSVRPGVFAGQGLFETGQRTGNASRGRDPRFNAAIFGNSRAQLLDPAKLSEATGLSFVQLTTPGSDPREQMTTMRLFPAPSSRRRGNGIWHRRTLVRP
jgi:hypothetical protein